MTPTSHPARHSFSVCPFSRKTISCYYYLSLQLRRTRSIRDSGYIYIYHSFSFQQKSTKSFGTVTCSASIAQPRRTRAGCWGENLITLRLFREWSVDWLGKTVERSSTVYVLSADQNFGYASLNVSAALLLFAQSIMGQSAAAKWTAKYLDNCKQTRVTSFFGGFLGIETTSSSSTYFFFRPANKIMAITFRSRL